MHNISLRRGRITTPSERFIYTSSTWVNPEYKLQRVTKHHTLWTTNWNKSFLTKINVSDTWTSCRFQMSYVCIHFIIYIFYAPPLITSYQFSPVFNKRFSIIRRSEHWLTAIVLSICVVLWVISSYKSANLPQTFD